jgi:ATP-dependent DNA ligase
MGAPLELLARLQPEGLTYVGSAFIALAGSERDELRVHLEVNKVGRCAIAKFRFPDAQWVKPEIIARVRHLAGTKYLRHGTIRGIA